MLVFAALDRRSLAAPTPLGCDTEPMRPRAVATRIPAINAFDEGKVRHVRKLFIAGNWKMNLVRATSLALVQQLKDSLHGVQNVDVAVCPPSVYLSDVAAALAGTPIGLGAQNAHSKSDGAYTGELSCGMLLDVGCRYVILGHSERRALFGESDAMVNEKLHAALAAGLTPIVCVGETLEEREAGQTATVVRTQCRGSLAGLTEDQMLRTVLAYEPVWAIGTGKTASPAQAEEVHADIRHLLSDLFSPATSARVIVQYGGSVKADNALELLSQPNIDGALVGGASLKADSFAAIVTAAATLHHKQA
jgi:triosephosphate isomerase (TIM)